MGTRRRLSREFKTEAVKLVRERGVTIAHAARDLDVHVSVLRGWVRPEREDPVYAFPGHGQQKPEALELTQLRRDLPANLPGSERWIAKAATKISRAEERGVEHDVILPVEVHFLERELDEVRQPVVLAGSDDVISGTLLLKHQPHRFDVSGRQAPVSLHVEVAEPEGFSAS